MAVDACARAKDRASLANLQMEKQPIIIRTGLEAGWLSIILEYANICDIL
jgi:hypothetical protein